MKHRFVTFPMLLPRISDKAAAQLLDILEQLLACVRHYYGPQIERWQRHQRRLEPPPPTRTSLPLLDDEPF